MALYISTTYCIISINERRSAAMPNTFVYPSDFTPYSSTGLRHFKPTLPCV
uniref:Uncharacterized protein n=1 Tax=Anguilla anguilla TaxID=7936 RepID=A0A0E9R823_ANGAN